MCFIPKIAGEPKVRTYSDADQYWRIRTNGQLLFDRPGDASGKRILREATSQLATATAGDFSGLRNLGSTYPLIMPKANKRHRAPYVVLCLLIIMYANREEWCRARRRAPGLF